MAVVCAPRLIGVGKSRAKRCTLCARPSAHRAMNNAMQQRLNKVKACRIKVC